MTVSVAMLPVLGDDLGDRSAAGVDRGDRTVAHQARARTSSGAGVPTDDALGGAMAVGRRVRSREQTLGADQRRKCLGLGDLDHAAGNADLVLQGDVLLERLDMLGLLQEEQVAHLVQVDLLVERVLERLERPQAAQPELDVHRIGELRANATSSLAGGAGSELALLQQDDVGDSGASEVIGGAEAHDAAADDHDGGAGRKLCRWHLRPHFARRESTRVGVSVGNVSSLTPRHRSVQAKETCRATHQSC